MKIKNKILVLATVLISCMSGYIRSANAQISVAEAFYTLARQNNTQKIESLLYRGYSLESPDERGYNPVCLSVVKNDKNAYKTLTSYGANKNPSCLKKIPESAYRRFFGYSPKTDMTPAYVPDSPYLLGTAVLAAGAVTAAYALRGSTGGGSKDDTSGGGGNPGGGDDPNPPSPPVDPNKCPPNSTYSNLTNQCECNYGYDHYEDATQCYAQIENCASQVKDTCSACLGNYVLKNNVCYAPIPHCARQNGDICEQCSSGYGTHSGNGKTCYVDILYCTTQEQDTCKECNSGYGTHGDVHNCYANIENCEQDQQVQTACRQCKPNYDTFGDPNADVCYSANICDKYHDPNAVPTDKGTRCICNINKGYTGEPGSCKRAEDESYSEGDGIYDVWNNLNELYCHSHGRYVDLGGGAWKCNCYPGYDNTSVSCDKCDTANGYGNFGTENTCYRDLDCERTYGEGFTQRGSSCVCKEGYIAYGSQCFKPAECTINQEQVKDASEPDACRCKPNFNEDCTACINDNFNYDAETGTCVPKACPEKWTGAMCEICPAQYKITIGEDGEQHCGSECADNRKPMAQQTDDTCSLCADGYRESSLYGTCIIDNCSEGVEGFEVVNGQCVCNESEGYIMSVTGECVKKGEDYIGLTNSNVNNGVLNVNNDGEYRDVYGMKPFIKTGEGENAEITYYDEVYNAYSTEGSQSGTINIANQNTGNIHVYGIYAPSVIYNASVANTQNQDASASGKIIINDTKSIADIHGIYGENGDSIYNGFAYASSDGGLSSPSNSHAEGSIEITKSETGAGRIVGIEGNGYIFNAYAQTDNGSAANVYSTGEIKLTNKSGGDIVGIEGTAGDKKVNNAFSFMNSAISDAVSKGSIKIEGKSNVFGIRSNSTVANSETQFNKSFSKIGEFSSEGIIDVLTDSNLHTAYGIQLNDNSGQKSEIYNAMGYNSKGTIKASNIHGGSAYGIYSEAATYPDKDEDGNPLLDDKGNSVVVYNNVYNAFRSSERYGGENVAAIGNIEVNLNGVSYDTHNAIGAYSAGNAFNAFANSGSDVKLESIGNIIVNDNSNTSNIKIRGIDGGGVRIANAYAMGNNKNTKTNVTGNIILNITGIKTGTTGEAAGIYSNAAITQNAQIYNAALVNDKSNVIGNITVQSPETTNALSKMYGIYASSTGEDAQPKTVYNAYYENSAGISEGSVHGTIDVKALSATRADEGNFYGIYVNNGTAYNAYSTNPDADAVGTINVDIYGSNRNSVAAGMYGINNAVLNNSGKSSINVITHGNNSVAYGLKGEDSRIYNDAEINVTSERSDAYGIYLNNGVVRNEENGVINVKGKGNNYGIYALSSDDRSATVYNSGEIRVSGGTNVGIYASGEKATVQNSGTIILGETGDEGRDIVLENGATLENAGTMSTAADFDFDAMGGNVILSRNGKFEAEEAIKGNLQVSSDVVMDSFDKTSHIEDALSAEDIKDLKLTSNSYLYSGKTQQNDNGKYDVVMEMKDFSEVYDGDVAQYYNKNYDNGKNMQLFNLLKSAKNRSEAEIADAEITGKAVLPNITMENLKVQRSLDRTMMSELFKDGEDIRKMVGADTLYGGRDDHGTLTGYDLNAQSMYALYDKKLDNRYRLGLGMSITHTDTDYNNDSTRKNFMVQGYVPLTYTNGKGLTAVSMARLGFADGEYKRRSLNYAYEADTNEITYGLLNELRYTVNLGGVNLTPFVGLNATGWYQNSIKEGDGSLDINIASSHVFSLESALGLYLDKEIEFNQDSKLNVALGIGYYHEFADPYGGFNARHGGSVGHYKLRDIEHLNSRNRGILSAKVNYDYKDFSIYGELLQYLEDEYPLDVDVGLKYKF